MNKRELLFFIYNVEFTQGWKGNSVSPIDLVVICIVSNSCHTRYFKYLSFVHGWDSSQTWIFQEAIVKSVDRVSENKRPRSPSRSIWPNFKSETFFNVLGFKKPQISLKMSQKVKKTSRRQLFFFVLFFYRVPRWVISRRSMSARWCSTRHSTDPPLTRIGPVPRSPAHLGCWAARGTKTWSPNQETGRRG